MGQVSSERKPLQWGWEGKGIRWTVVRTGAKTSTEACEHVKVGACESGRTEIK